MADNTEDNPSSDDVPLAIQDEENEDTATAGLGDENTLSRPDVTPMEDVETSAFASFIVEEAEETTSAARDPDEEDQGSSAENPFVSSSSAMDHETPSKSIPSLFNVDTPTLATSVESQMDMDITPPINLSSTSSLLDTSRASTPTPTPMRASASPQRQASPHRSPLAHPDPSLSPYAPTISSPNLNPTSPSRSIRSPSGAPSLAPPHTELNPKASLPNPPSPTISFTAPTEPASDLDDESHAEVSAMLVQAATNPSPLKRTSSPSRVSTSTLRSPSPVRVVQAMSDERLARVLQALGLGEVFGQVEGHDAVRMVMVRVEEVMFPKTAEGASPEFLRGRVAQLEAEKVALEMEMESHAHTLENQTRAIRQELLKVSGSEEGLRQQVETLTKTLDSERRSLEQGRERSDAHVREMATLKATIDSLELDKRNLAATIASKIEEQDSYSREIARLRSDVDSSRDEIRSLNAQLSEMQTREVQIRLERATRDQESEQLKQNIAWLNEELSRKAEEFKTYRREKSEAVSRLELQLENALQEKRTFELQASSHQEKANVLEKRVAEMVEKLNETENRIISSEQSFKNEMNAQVKISSLYQAHTHDLEQQVKELQNLVRDLEDGLERLSESRDEAVTALKEQTEAFQTEIEQKELKIEELSAQVKSINAAGMSEMRKLPLGLELLSPAAQAASQFQKSGKTFTEIYAEYTKLQDENLLANQEIVRLTECLNHILGELAERAPILQQFKEDKEAIENEAARLSNDLKRALEEKEEIASNSRASQDQIQSLESRNRSLMQETHDLSRQIHHLILELENLRAGPGGLRSGATSLAELGEDPAEGSQSGMVISQRLVIFNSIAELQSQNQQLRASLRTVGDALAKANADVEEKIRDRLERELEEAASTMEGVREQLRLANLKCESYVRERDQWKRIAENRGLGGSPAKNLSQPTTPSRGGDPMMDVASGEYERLYRELQRDFDSFRKETGLDTRTLKEANEALRNEKSELSIQAARLNSNLENLDERYRSLSQNFDLKTKENNQLRDRINSLINSQTSQETKAQEMANSLVELRSNMDALNSECRQLRSERELLKSSEARVMAENQGLIQQRNMANEHLKSLQRMFDDLERQGRDNVKRVEDKSGRLEKEVEVLRHQLSASQDEIRSMSLRREADQRDLLLKVESYTKDLSVSQRDCEVARMEERLLQQKVEDLTSRLASAEQRLKEFDGQVVVAASTSTISPSDQIKELKAELAQARSELDIAKESLRLEKERVEQYKSIANAAEEKLTEFNATYDRYREETDQKLVEAESMIASLERTRGDLEVRLNRTIQEITELQEKADLERMEISNERHRLNDEIARLKNAESNARESVKSLQLELNSQANRLLEARSDYERVIIAEAERIKLLQSSEKEVIHLKKECREAKGRASTAEQQLSSAERSWEAIQQKLKEDYAAVERSNADLVEQNKILHDQFESLNTRLQTLQNLRSSSNSADAAGAEIDGITISSDTEKNLADVVRYLRREKDILEKEREVSEQKIARMHSQIEHLQRSLDEARISLNDERQKSAESGDAKRMHTELLEKIDSLNILRESNATLRSQNEVHVKRITMLEMRIREKENEIGPLKEENITLKAELDSVRVEIKGLEEDNQKWKGRTQQILAKYERIDPVEHQQLKEKVSQMDQNASKEAEAHKSKLDELNSKLAEADMKLASALKDLENMRASHLVESQSFTEQLDFSRKEKAELVSKANGIAKKFRDQLAQQKETIRTLTLAKDNLLTEKERLVKEHSESIAQLRQELQAKFDEEKKNFDAQLRAMPRGVTSPAARQPMIQNSQPPTQQIGTPVTHAQSTVVSVTSVISPPIATASAASPSRAAVSTPVTSAPMDIVRPTPVSVPQRSVAPISAPSARSTAVAPVTASPAPVSVPVAPQPPVTTQSTGPSPLAKRTREEEVPPQELESEKTISAALTENVVDASNPEHASKRMRLEDSSSMVYEQSVTQSETVAERPGEPMQEDLPPATQVSVPAPAQTTVAAPVITASPSPHGAVQLQVSNSLPAKPVAVTQTSSAPRQNTSAPSSAVAAQPVQAASLQTAPVIPAPVLTPKPLEAPVDNTSTTPQRSAGSDSTAPNVSAPSTPPVKIQRGHALTTAALPTPLQGAAGLLAASTPEAAPLTPAPVTQPLDNAMAPSSTAQQTPTPAAPARSTPISTTTPVSTPAPAASLTTKAPAASSIAGVEPVSAQTMKNELLKMKLAKLNSAQQSQPIPQGQSVMSAAQAPQPGQVAVQAGSPALDATQRRQRIIRTPGQPLGTPGGAVSGASTPQSQPSGQPTRTPQAQQAPVSSPVHAPAPGGPGTPMPQRLGSVPPLGAGRGLARTRLQQQMGLQQQNVQQGGGQMPQDQQNMQAGQMGRGMSSPGMGQRIQSMIGAASQQPGQPMQRLQGQGMQGQGMQGQGVPGQQMQGQGMQGIPPNQSPPMHLQQGQGMSMRGARGGTPIRGQGTRGTRGVYRGRGMPMQGGQGNMPPPSQGGSPNQPGGGSSG